MLEAHRFKHFLFNDRRLQVLSLHRQEVDTFDIVDFALGSLSRLTSQPNFNFLYYTDLGAANCYLYQVFESICLLNEISVYS
jgi:pyruvate carboxylase